MSISFASQANARLAMVAGVALFVVLAYWDSFSSMYALWQLSDHRHGILVLPIAGFLIWRVRNRVAGEAVAPQKRGTALVLVLAIGWLFAKLTSIQVIEHVTVLAMIPAAVYAFLGPALTSKLLFPLIFLMLATPISDSLIPPLMIITADVSTALLQLSGFPVFREGQYISLPGGNFVVADVCSGVNYLLTGVMISSLFAYLTYQTKRKRVLFVGLTAAVLIVANGVRAYIVMAVASASNMQYFAGKDHIYFGWVLFGIVIMFLMWLGMKYADDDVDLNGGQNPAEVKTSRLSRMPLIGALFLVMLAVTVKPLEGDIANTGWILAIASVILVAVLVLDQRQGVGASTVASSGTRSRRESLSNVAVICLTTIVLVFAPALISFANVPSAAIQAPKILPIEECGTPGEWASAWTPKMSAPDYEVKASFNCGNHVVNIFMAGYERSVQGKELIGSSHQLAAPEWDRYSHTEIRRIGESISSKEVRETVVEGLGFSGITWYWYDIDGDTTTSSVFAKALQSFALLSRRPSGGMVVLLHTSPIGDEETARRAMTVVAEAVGDTTAVVDQGVAE